MQLTRKKKLIIAAAAIRDIQILGTSILQYKSICTELKPIIREQYGEDFTKSIFNLFSNMNFINSELEKEYIKDKRSKAFLKDTNGLTHLEEMSSQVIDKMNEVINQYKVK